MVEYVDEICAAAIKASYDYYIKIRKEWVSLKDPYRSPVTLRKAKAITKRNNGKWPMSKDNRELWISICEDQLWEEINWWRCDGFRLMSSPFPSFPHWIELKISADKMVEEWVQGSRKRGGQMFM